MPSIYVICIFVIFVGVLAVLQRLIRGPTLLDRILAVNVIGTKTIVLVALLGYEAGRAGFFLDIALSYALINYVATIAVLRYVEGKRSNLDAARPAPDQADPQAGATDPEVPS